MIRARKFFALAPHERKLFFDALCWVGAARVSLWFIPFRLVRGAFTHAARHRNAPIAPAISSTHIARAITRASRFIPRANCLPQALAALVLLNRNGFTAELKIGVALDAQHKLNAHAWVECQGQIVIGGAGITQYTPLANMNVPIA